MQTFLIGAALAVLASSSVLAQPIQFDQTRIQSVEMLPGEVRVFRFDKEFTDLMVGDREVADVSTMTDQRFAVTAKKLGMTSIVALSGGKDVVGHVMVGVSLPENVGRRPVTLYKNGQPDAVYGCDRRSGGCEFQRTLRTPTPIISTGPVITGDAVRATQGR